MPFRGWGHSWPGHFLPTDRVGHWSLRGAVDGPDGADFNTVAPQLKEARPPLGATPLSNAAWQATTFIQMVKNHQPSNTTTASSLAGRAWNWLPREDASFRLLIHGDCGVQGETYLSNVRQS